MQSTLTRSYSTNRVTTTQRRDASPAKSQEFTTLPSTPRSTAPASSLTWWRTHTQWHLIFSSTATGPNRGLCRAAPCSTSSLVTRCGSRWLCQSTMDFTPAPRQTAPSPASWCTQTGKTLLCLHDMCFIYIPLWEMNHNPWFFLCLFQISDWDILDKDEWCDTEHLYLCKK